MDLAKPGDIKNHCDPNAISTFMEYLLDYASPQTVVAGKNLIEKQLLGMDQAQKEFTAKLIDQVKKGKRDIFV